MALVIALNHHSLHRSPTEQKTFDFNHTDRDAHSVIANSVAQSVIHSADDSDPPRKPVGTP